MKTQMAWTVLYNILLALKDEISEDIIKVNSGGFAVFVRYSYDPKSDTLSYGTFGTLDDASRDHNPIESFAMPRLWEDMKRLFVPPVAPKYHDGSNGTIPGDRIPQPRVGFVDDGTFVGFRCGR